jgi:hypothetical protein
MTTSQKRFIKHVKNTIVSIYLVISLYCTYLLMWLFTDILKYGV